MIADITQTIARINSLGIPVVLLGPAVQFRSRLPSMLMRAHLLDIDARPDDFVLPYTFSLDQRMKAALPHMVKNGGGVIINTASIAGMVAIKGAAAYCASKAGVLALTRVAAMEYGRYPLRG